jgi:hypothetical protein
MGVNEIEFNVDYQVSEIATEAKQSDATKSVTMRTAESEPAPRGLARLMQGLSSFAQNNRDVFLLSLAADARKMMTTRESNICHGVFQDELVVYLQAPMGPGFCSNHIEISPQVKKFSLRTSVQFTDGDSENVEILEGIAWNVSLCAHTTRLISACDLHFSLKRLHVQDEQIISELPHYTKIVHIKAEFLA